MDILVGEATKSKTVVTEPVPEPDGLRAAGSRIVSASALPDVQRTRRASIFVIVVHFLCFVVYYFLTQDFWPWPARLVNAATAIAFVVGGVVLCSFSKGVYGVAAVFFALGAAVDLALVMAWSYVVYRINERNQGNDDEDYDIPTGYFAIFIVPAVLSTLGFLAASVFAFKVVCNWPEDGALRENQDQNTPPV